MPHARVLTSTTAATRIDTDQIRLQHPIADVVTRYGVELRRSGAHFSGRCPFHPDGGRPNLVVFPRSGRWVCFRCDARGDAITFVQRIDGVSFREAVERLGGGQGHLAARGAGPIRRTQRMSRNRPELGADERATLSAAIELYANRLMADSNALAYMAGRGFEPALLERERVGYAAGEELVPYLLWRGLPVKAARRVGLLRADGREHMDGRIVFPECRNGHAVWATGRALRDDTEPRYLGLPGAGRRALFGWDSARRDLRGVCIVEGPMDALALRKWGVPGLALCGTGIGPAMLDAIGRWSRLYIVMDADAAGRDATARLLEVFGPRAVPVSLPDGVKDPAEMAVLPNGAILFAAAIKEACARVPRCAARTTSEP